MKSVFTLLVVLSVATVASAVKIVSDVSPRSSSVHIPGTRHVISSVGTAPIGLNAIN